MSAPCTWTLEKTVYFVDTGLPLYNEQERLLGGDIRICPKAKVTGLGFHQQCRTSTRLAPALSPNASFPVTQSQWPHPAGLLYLVLHYLPASSLPWEGVNPVTVDVDTSLWRTSYADFGGGGSAPPISLTPARALGWFKGMEGKIKRTVKDSA